MKKKYICCVHDKKSDSFDAFMIFDNMSDAMRAFQTTCEKNEVFNKWPQDFEFMIVDIISFENGEINEKNEITKEGKFLGTKEHYSVIAQAQDFVAIKKAKNENNTK